MKIWYFLSLIVLSFSISSNEDLPYCNDTVTQISLNDKTHLGFSAQDLLNAASGERDLNWYWAYKKGKASLQAKIVSVVDVARYIHRVPANSNKTPCFDSIEVDALLVFSTQDQLFNESVPITLFESISGKDANFVTQKEFDAKAKSFYGELNLPIDVDAAFGIGGKFSAEHAHFTLYGGYHTTKEENSAYTLFPVGFAY